MLMVAPDLETPGTRASICAPPYSSRVTQVEPVQWPLVGREPVDDAEDQAEQHEVDADDPEVPEGGLDGVLEEEAGDADRHVPMMMYHPIRASSWPRSAGRQSERSQVVTIRQMSLRKYQMTASSVPIWVTAVKDAPGSSLPEELREDRQVGAAGDRQELGQALQDPQQDGLEPAHVRSPSSVEGLRMASDSIDR